MKIETYKSRLKLLYEARELLIFNSMYYTVRILNKEIKRLEKLILKNDPEVELIKELMN